MTLAVVWALLKANWRLVLAGLCVALVLMGWGYVQHLQHTVAAQKTQVKAAKTEAAVAQVTTQVIDHYVHDTQVIHERTVNAVQKVREAPGASQALDPGFRSALCAQLASVRAGPVCAPADDPAKPAGGVQGP